MYSQQRDQTKEEHSITLGRRKSLTIQECRFAQIGK